MTELNSLSNFFSFAFHKHFIRDVLLSRLHPKKEEYQSPFAHHGSMEFVLLIAACIVVVAIGLPSAMKGSLFWGIASVLGVAGFIVLFAMSILSERGSHYSYESFQLAPFFFFVILGITAGLFSGIIYKSLWIEISGALLGFLAGYSLGIFAAIWINYLGRIKNLFIVISYGAIVGMVVLDLVFLFG